MVAELNAAPDWKNKSWKNESRKNHFENNASQKTATLTHLTFSLFPGALFSPVSLQPAVLHFMQRLFARADQITAALVGVRGFVLIVVALPSFAEHPRGEAREPI